jgi:hypothetical protein
MAKQSVYQWCAWLLTIDDTGISRHSEVPASLRDLQNQPQKGTAPTTPGLLPSDDGDSRELVRGDHTAHR